MIDDNLPLSVAHDLDNTPIRVGWIYKVLCAPFREIFARQSVAPPVSSADLDVPFSTSRPCK